MTNQPVTNKVFTTKLIEENLLLFFGSCIILNKNFHICNSSNSISKALETDLNNLTGISLKDIVEIPGVKIEEELENKLKNGYFFKERYKLKLLHNSKSLEVSVSGFYTGLICDLNNYIILRINRISNFDNQVVENCTNDETKWDDFLYSVSHNIRGPIATIKGLTMIAELEKYSTQNQYYFEQIYKHADILDHYLKSLCKYNHKDPTS